MTVIPLGDAAKYAATATERSVEHMGIPLVTADERLARLVRARRSTITVMLLSELA